MSPGRMIRGLVACCLLAAAAAAKDQAAACMSGVRCGTMCAPLGGSCMNNQCFDSLSYPALCYAPMATAFTAPQAVNIGGGAAPSWWQPSSFFPASFFPLRPFQTFMAPMQPLQPFQPFTNLLDCGGNGPCQEGSFCDPSGACREDTCENQFQFGCPKDTGSLQKVNCLHNSGFNRCYESSTGGFKCYKGPAGGTTSCASNGYSSTSASLTSTFNTAASAGAAATATGSGSGSSSAAGATAGAGNAQRAGEVSNTAAAAGSTAGTQPAKSSNAAAAAGSGAGAVSDNRTANDAAAAGVAAAAAAANGRQHQQHQSKRLRRKAAKGAAAAAAATEEPANKATKTFIQNGANSNQQVTVSPDGKTVTVTHAANDGSSGAIGSASGNHQYVATNIIPGGSSVISSSSGSNGAPAVASAASGAQPLYTPNPAGKK